MGQTLSSETLSISGGDGYRYWVGLTMKPSEVGCKKTVYKGVLLGHGPRQWEKVVAKAFTDIPGTKESWKHELNKADVTKQLAAKFVQEHPSLCAIRIVIPGIVQMDRVSNINKRLADKDDGRGLTKDEWISVEELIPGKMGRYSPWSEKHTKDVVESKLMQTFSHFTYKYTNGELVACDFQGIYDSNSSQYIFTDSSIHSIFKLYGLFDQGEYGISEFFKLHKCNEFCNGWSKPTPLTPPPSFDAACMFHNNLTPASAFENIVFPAYNSENVSGGHLQNVQNRDTSERRRHRSDHHPHLQRRAEGLWNGQSLDLHDNRRHLHSSFDEEASSGHNNPPPRYEDVPKSLTANNSLPPHYDSLVSLSGHSNNHTIDLIPRSSARWRHQSGSLNQLKNGDAMCEACNSLKSRQRSATEPLLYLENTSQNSGACATSSNTSFLQHEGQPRCKKCKSAPTFYCNEAAPSVVPSAPPDDSDDISGT